MPPVVEVFSILAGLVLIGSAGAAALVLCRRTLKCDRCGVELEGATRESESHGDMTAGYYHVAEGSGWRYLARVIRWEHDPEFRGASVPVYEERVCDCCVWCDEKYIARHGHIKHVKPPALVTLGPLVPQVCTRDWGHDNPCNGFPRENERGTCYRP